MHEFTLSLPPIVISSVQTHLDVIQLGPWEHARREVEHVPNELLGALGQCHN